MTEKGLYLQMVLVMQTGKDLLSAMAFVKAQVKAKG